MINLPNENPIVPIGVGLGHWVFVDLKRIFYIENYNNQACIHMIDGEQILVPNFGLKNLCEVIKGMIQISSQYAVSPYYLREIRTDHLKIYRAVVRLCTDTGKEEKFVVQRQSVFLKQFKLDVGIVFKRKRKNNLQKKD